MFEFLMFLCIKSLMFISLFVIFFFNCFLCGALLSIDIPLVFFYIGLFVVLQFSIICIYGLVSYYEDELQ